MNQCADSIVSGFESSIHYGLLSHIYAAGSYSNCLVKGNSHEAEEGAVIYSRGSSLAPVMLKQVKFEGNDGINLLMDGSADSEPTFFSDEDRIVALTYANDYDYTSFDGPTTTSTAPLADAPKSKFFSLQSAPIRKTIQVRSLLSKTFDVFPHLSRSTVY